VIANVPKLNSIGTAIFLTPAERPANSALSCAKIEHAFRVDQLEWRLDL
jgi:dTDP-4-dehydrorhamnose reductase